MSNPKPEFLMSLGRFVVCYSHIQNILQEGIYILSAKLHKIEDNMVRCFMHDMSINQLKVIFLTLATEYGTKSDHIDNDQLKLIRHKINTELEGFQRLRNKVMHSVWNEKFWEGAPGNHTYRMLYHKNKQFKFKLDDEEFNFEKLNDLSRAALSLSQYIHDFLTCISDGDNHKDKSFDNYFIFENNEAVFPRESDNERFKNIDDYI